MDSKNSQMCIKGCGFFGSADKNNMCSKCYLQYLNQNLLSSSSSSSLNNSASAVKKRCESCNKKVGLTGFACRCGKLLCGMHRFPKEHSCSFDFKKADREILAKQILLVKADKLAHRI